MAVRKRLPQHESRIAALDAARALLIESGPQAVTLKAVAARMGRTHANLLHHFGTAAQLQRSLASHLAGAICSTIAEAVLANRAGLASARDVVDLTFDAFARDFAREYLTRLCHVPPADDGTSAAPHRYHRPPTTNSARWRCARRRCGDWNTSTPR